MYKQHTDSTNVLVTIYKPKNKYETLPAKQSTIFNQPIQNVHCFEVEQSSEFHNMFQICNLVNSKMDDECCESLSQCEIPHLNQLYLSQCEISVIGFSHIFQCQLPNLTTLSICHNHLSKQSVRHLLKAEWNNLTKIQLFKCGFSYENFKMFIKCKWNKLKTINLMLNKIDDRCIDCVHCAYWPSLNQLNSKYNDQMSNMGIMNVAKLNLQTVKVNQNLKQRVAKVMRELGKIN